MAGEGTGKVGVAYRYYFCVQDSEGLPADITDLGDFAVSVRNPANNATSSPSVTAVPDPIGMYFFDIPGSFSTTHGVGVYGIQIALDSAVPAITNVSGTNVLFSIYNLDDIVESIIGRIVTNGLGTPTTTQTMFRPDNVTPLRTWTLTTNVGEDVETSLGVQTNRSGPT